MMENEVTSSTDPIGGKAQELAEPAGTGGKEQEVTVPAAGEGTSQPEEERRANAAARRKAEQEAHDKELTDRINAENGKRMDTLIASMGKINPFTKKPIRTLAELEEFNSEQAKRQRDAEFSKLGISREAFDALIEEHPTVKAARDAATALEAQKAELERQQISDGIRQELDAIAKLDPNIKTAEALMQHPQYAEVKRLVRENGHSLSEAFRIATEPQRAKSQIDHVRDAAARTAAGTGHMTSMQSAGGASPQVTVPPDVMRGYRLSNPKITNEEAQKRYARFLALKRIKS